MSNDKAVETITRRSLDDLQMYEKFFPEVMDLEVSASRVHSKTNRTIVLSSQTKQRGELILSGLITIEDTRY